MSAKPEPRNPRASNDRPGLDARTDRRLLLRASAAVIALERAWPALMLAAGLAALFAAASLFELWDRMSGTLHGLLLALFALSFLAALGMAARAIASRGPWRESAIERLERDNGLERQVLRALDEPPASRQPARSFALAHRAKIEAELPRLRGSAFRPATLALDPSGLRMAPALLLAVALAYGWGDWGPRLARGFVPELRDAGAAQAERFVAELWLEPPAYTGAPPLSASAVRDLEASDRPIAVPEGSRALVRLRGVDPASTRLRQGRSDVPMAALDARAGQAELIVEGDGALEAVASDGEVLRRWTLATIEDQPPSARFVEPPSATTRGALRLDVAAEDDYGVARLSWVLRRTDKMEEPARELPIARGESSVARRFHLDLTSHPAAGLEVELTLEVEDVAGNVARSAPTRLTLPEKVFRSPLAKAVAALRKRLEREPSEQDRIANGLDDLAPAAEPLGAGIQLALSATASRLRSARGPEARREASDMMWRLALAIEEGALSDAERRLRELQDRIAEAMSEGADPEEIDQLMNELEQAMAEYMEELLRQAMREEGPSPDAQAPQVGDGQRLEARDLREMLDRAREMMQAGRMDEAARMMAQLRDMLENMQAQAGQAQPSPGAEALSDLQELIRRQQQLLDETFRMRNGQTPNGQPGREGAQNQPGERPQPGEGSGRGPGRGSGQGRDPNGASATPGELAELQELLRRGLGELMRRLGETGQAIPGPLGEGEMQMRDAVGALRDGAPQMATPAQNQALDALRQGGQQLADELARQMQGQGQPAQAGGRQQGRDPLGRSTRNQGGFARDDVEVPDDAALGQARAVLEELRRRLGARDLTAEERSYLERLLERF